MMRLAIYSMILSLLINNTSIAQSFKYECVTNRCKVYFHLLEDTSGYRIQYTIVNTSPEDSLYCSPYCLIGSRRDSTKVTFDIGVLKYSSIIPDGFAKMRVLAPRDSINLESNYVSSPKVKLLELSFNALALSDLSKKQRKHFFHITKWAVDTAGLPFRWIDLADYMGIYTEWFKMAIPICTK